MKLKFTLLAAFIVFCFTVKAQQIQNPGLENWTGATPNSFSDYESVASVSTSVLTFQDTTTKTEGNSSAKIITDTIAGFGSLGPVAGFLSYGSAAQSGLSIGFKGGPLAGRPDTISFDFKYTTPGTDTAVAIVEGTQNGVVAFGGSAPLPHDTGWTHYSLIVQNAYNPSTPGNIDTLLLIFSPSANFLHPATPAVLGSTLHIDNIQMGYDPTAGVKDIKDQINLKVYPNPVTSILNISADKDLVGNSVQIFNMNGQLVSNKTLEGNANTVDLSGFSSGTYIYKITDKQNNVIDVNKISVVK